MQLDDYFRSSAAYRVRIALNLKGIEYRAISRHLRHGGQRSDEYLARNPQGLVPALTTTGQTLTQSLAIIEYLEETQPQPPLLPLTALERARVRSLALQIACDLHPLNNLRVLNYLKQPLGHTQEEVNTWYRHWVELELAALETRLRQDDASGRFCHGDKVTLADVCLVPQMANARRFQCDTRQFPILVRIDQACNELPAFEQAAPANQADSESLSTKSRPGTL